MSFLQEDIIITWEWPANRTIKYKVVVEILELTPVKKTIQSPSFATDRPDSVSLRGKVIKNGLLSENEIVKLVLPILELEEIEQGARLVLAMVNESTTVCVKSIPSALTDTEEKIWLESLDCK